MGFEVSAALARPLVMVAIKAAIKPSAKRRRFFDRELLSITPPGHNEKCLILLWPTVRSNEGPQGSNGARSAPYILGVFARCNCRGDRPVALHTDFARVWRMPRPSVDNVRLRV